MIHVIRQQQIITPERLMDLLVFDNRNDQLLAAYIKIGLARQPLKLLKGKDYRDFRRESKALANWKKKMIWMPNKKIQIKATLLNKIETCENDDAALDKIAAEFSKKAVKGLAFVRKEVSSRPLAEAKAKVAHEKFLSIKAERDEYYSDAEDVGLF